MLGKFFFAGLLIFDASGAYEAAVELVEEEIEISLRRSPKETFERILKLFVASMRLGPTDKITRCVELLRNGPPLSALEQKLLISEVCNQVWHFEGPIEKRYADQILELVGMEAIKTPASACYGRELVELIDPEKTKRPRGMTGAKP
jgi:hypothetical protein